jgi:hypothetical protein
LSLQHRKSGGTEVQHHVPDIAARCCIGQTQVSSYGRDCRRRDAKQIDARPLSRVRSLADTAGAFAGKGGQPLHFFRHADIGVDLQLGLLRQ